MLKTRKLSVNDLNKSDILNIRYFPMKNEDVWKTNVINELIDVKEGLLSIPETQNDEVDAILAYLCVS